MRALVRYAHCPACGRPHRFRLPAGQAAAEYGYVCPATSLPAAVHPTGSWLVLPDPPPGAVNLSAVASDWRFVPHYRPAPGADA